MQGSDGSPGKARPRPYPPALPTAARSLIAVLSRPAGVMLVAAVLLVTHWLPQLAASPRSLALAALIAGKPWTAGALRYALAAFVMGLAVWLALGAALVTLSNPARSLTAALTPRRSLLHLLVGLLSNFGIAAPGAPVWALLLVLSSGKASAAAPGAGVMALFLLSWAGLLVICFSLSAGVVALSLAAREPLDAPLPQLALRVFGRALTLLVGSRLWPSLALGFAILAVCLPLTLLLLVSAYASWVAAVAGAGTARLALLIVQSVLASAVMLVAAMALRDGLTEVPLAPAGAETRITPDRPSVSEPTALAQTPEISDGPNGTGSAF